MSRSGRRSALIMSITTVCLIYAAFSLKYPVCKIKDSKDNKEPLFFLFAEDRQSVSRLRFETNNIRLSEILRTEINANSISWLDREGFSNTRYQLNRTTLELSTNPGKRACEAMSAKSLKKNADNYLSSNMIGNKI